MKEDDEMTLDELIQMMSTQAQPMRDINDATGLSYVHQQRNKLVDALAGLAPSMPADTTGSEYIATENPNLADPRVATRALAEMIPNARLPETGLEGIMTAAQLSPYIAAGVKAYNRPIRTVQPDWLREIHAGNQQRLPEEMTAMPQTMQEWRVQRANEIKDYMDTYNPPQPPLEEKLLSGNIDALNLDDLIVLQRINPEKYAEIMANIKAARQPKAEVIQMESPMVDQIKPQLNDAEIQALQPAQADVYKFPLREADPVRKLPVNEKGLLYQLMEEMAKRKLKE